MAYSNQFVQAYAVVTRKHRPSLLSHLPRIVSHFLGHRPRKPNPPPEWLRLLCVLLATFAGMLCHISILKYAPVFRNWNCPEVIPSFGATAILIYNFASSALAQPKRAFCGSMICALIGVAITKLFMTNPNNEKHLWIAGALCTSVASVAMDFTDTVHPPGGATALLPSLDPRVRALGWKYLAVMAIGLLVFIGIALLMDNLVFQYPTTWWDAADGLRPHQIVITDTRIILPNDIELSDDELKMLEPLQELLASTAPSTEAMDKGKLSFWRRLHG